MPILNGKKVVDLEIDGVDSGDYPDFCNAYFSSGCYEDGTPLTDDELNKVKVSDVEGDVNVAGVFVNWTHDDAHQVDEINMAMTGDMIIRITAGQRLRLLNLFK